MRARRRLIAALGLAAALLAAGCVHAPAAVPADTRAAVAPAGPLRVGVYAGSPTSLVVGRGGQRGGVAYELGTLAAKELGVPVRIVEFERVAQVIDAMKIGEIDFTFTNATEARARDLDFTPPLVRLELGYLAPAGSRLTDVAQVDQPGVRVGVTEGSSSQAALSRRFKNARIITAPSLDQAGQMLHSGAIDVFATNKGILFEMSEKVPGSRVLTGRWGVENLAIAIPKGRPLAAMDWMRAFADRQRGSAQLQAILDRAGLRGTAND